MNLGRLRQRIYRPPPLTTRALPREQESMLEERVGEFNLSPRLRTQCDEIGWPALASPD